MARFEVGQSRPKPLFPHYPVDVFAALGVIAVPQDAHDAEKQRKEMESLINERSRTDAPHPSSIDKERLKELRRLFEDHKTTVDSTLKGVVRSLKELCKPPSTGRGP